MEWKDSLVIDPDINLVQSHTFNPFDSCLVSIMEGPVYVNGLDG